MTTGIIIDMEWIITSLLISGFIGVFLGIIIGIKAIRVTLDRYRLKYGFDRELESIDVKNPNNLAKIEKRFKERIQKDRENKGYKHIE